MKWEYFIDIVMTIGTCKLIYIRGMPGRVVEAVHTQKIMVWQQRWGGLGQGFSTSRHAWR